MSTVPPAEATYEYIWWKSEATDCSERAFAEKRYSEVRACYAACDLWVETHDVPEPGWDWPWASLRGEKK